jgi:DNA-binding beta-propeller fold protein YncE
MMAANFVREVEMKSRIAARSAMMALCMVLNATLAFSQTPAAPQSPGWFLQGSAPDPGGRLVVGTGGQVISSGGFGSGSSSAATSATATSAAPPPCRHAPVCGNRWDGPRSTLQRVEWRQTMGYTYAYPVDLPQGGGGVSAVKIDSKGNLWVFQRNAVGKPQLFEFGPDRKLIRAVGDEVIGHQEKAHGMAIDSENNVWICDANGATIMKLSPEGKVLMTLGIKGKRGDWDEAKGQRLLWQPLDLAFAPNGDIYIGEGHANESPNDAGSDDPANNIGAARVIHLDKTGKFINQWYGNSIGQGKFSMVHGLAVDPANGNIWLGDREEYRLIVFTGDGKFVKTVQMRNLMCAVAFDPRGSLWVASGQDGQLLKIDQNGNVLGAVGNGSGTGDGQFIEANYMTWDKQGNLYAGDTSVGRVTEMIVPGKK